LFFFIFLLIKNSGERKIMREEKSLGLITLLVLVFCQTRKIRPALLKPDKTGPSVIIFVALLVLPPIFSSKNADVAHEGLCGIAN
jgi:hypothetical protein